MINQSQMLETLANSILNEAASYYSKKPNYSNKDFFNAILIFHTTLMDKVYDYQNVDDMSVDLRLEMVEKCCTELHKLILTYTNLNTHKIEEFL